MKKGRGVGVERGGENFRVVEGRRERRKERKQASIFVLRCVFTLACIHSSLLCSWPSF